MICFKRQNRDNLTVLNADSEILFYNIETFLGIHNQFDAHWSTQRRNYTHVPYIMYNLVAIIRVRHTDKVTSPSGMGRWRLFRKLRNVIYLRFTNTFVLTK